MLNLKLKREQAAKYTTAIASICDERGDLLPVDDPRFDTVAVEKELAKILGNLSECALKQSDFDEALDKANDAIDSDPSFLKVDDLFMCLHPRSDSIPHKFPSWWRFLGLIPTNVEAALTIDCVRSVPAIGCFERCQRLLYFGQGCCSLIRRNATLVKDVVRSFEGLPLWSRMLFAHAKDCHFGQGCCSLIRRTATLSTTGVTN
jgi:hypothetical protein